MGNCKGRKKSCLKSKSANEGTASKKRKYVHFLEDKEEETLRDELTCKFFNFILKMIIEVV